MRTDALCSSQYLPMRRWLHCNLLPQYLTHPLPVSSARSSSLSLHHPRLLNLQHTRGPLWPTNLLVPRKVMFTSFRQGAETENQGWDGASSLSLSPSSPLLPSPFLTNSLHTDTPSYVPGRFHAHPLPASPPPGRTAALAGQSPIHSSRSSLRDYNPFTSSSPPTSTTTAAGAVKHRRGVSRRTNLGDVGGIEDRLLGEGGVRGGGSGAEPPDERSWLLLRPGRKRVESWLENWWRRWLVLVGVPCVFVSPRASGGEKKGKS